ncbi:hypothetical protein U732_30 [Clostridium argentinense CDC 2741]|uniref:Actin-like protein N-terminal domain-containing protein n=2 Tax=Clostridium argentinense TaxID=29341 RepID=A0A0C1TWH4_9CLOT|nr:ParM/StbA family protein [Clostridium argentinense]KIE45059.1 hypothetical protein U732_30 [Clostridium argentinense CDC 2741]BBB39350.1 hypothetical protein [Clostridium argentinense]
MDKDFIKINCQVGSDNGNSEHDIVINGYNIAQPNVVSKVRKLPMLDEVNPEFVVENIESNLLITIDSPSAAPGIYYLGDYALRSGNTIRNIEVGVDNNKIDSDIVIINTVGQIAGYAVKEAYKVDKDLNKRILVDVDMTTALPVTQYSKANAEFFSNKFQGKHKVTVHVGNIRADVEVNFDTVKTIPEGVTAIHALTNDKYKDIFKEFNKKYDTNVDGTHFKNKKILHVAIGEGTTEYPITNGLVFDPNFIEGSNNGIGHAIDKSLNEFKEEVNLLNYSRQNYSTVIRKPEHKFHQAAMEIIEGYIEEEANAILHNVMRELQRANNEVDIICVYGGGSILMRNQLEKKLDNISTKSTAKLLYIPQEYAVDLESLGMYEFTIGNIFKALKQKK